MQAIKRSTFFIPYHYSKLITAICGEIWFRNPFDAAIYMFYEANNNWMHMIRKIEQKQIIEKLSVLFFVLCVYQMFKYI